MRASGSLANPVCAGQANSLYSLRLMTAALASPPTAGIHALLLIDRRLRTARRRLLAQRLVDLLCACVLGAEALLLAGGALHFLRGGTAFAWPWAGIAGAAAVAAALLGTASGWISLITTARTIDARAQTHDRFQTALAFANRAPRTPFEELTLAECTRFSASFPVARWTPIRLPRAARFLPVPALALALLCWHAALHLGEPPADPGLDAAISQRSSALAALAEKLRHDAAQNKTPPAAEVAAALHKSTERLREGANGDPAGKLKNALGEISSLEAMLAAMKQAAARPETSPAELAALSAALAANAQTQDAAKSLQQGKLDQAAAQLERLLRQLEKQGNAAQALQQLAQSLQEQAAKLSAAEKNEVARQTQQAAQAAQSGQNGLSEKALQRLADLLRQLGAKGGEQAEKSSGGSGASAPRLTEQELQSLLNALENMKAGLSRPGGGNLPGGQDGATGSSSLALVESFANAGGTKSGDTPSGGPGTEHDGGTSDHIFASRPMPEAQPGGSATRLEGMLGDGQALQELVGAAGDHSKASARYRDLYNAMAPAAQDAVEQEDIPLGARFFIGRYFQSIRPAD